MIPRKSILHLNRLSRIEKCANISCYRTVFTRSTYLPTTKTLTTKSITKNTTLQPPSQHLTTSFHTTTPHSKMSSDADYMSFLDKANEDPSSGTTHTSSSNSKPQQKFSTASTVNTEKVHPVLKKVDVDYVSDTDERFEVVSLKWDGKGTFIYSLLPFSPYASLCFVAL